MPRDGNRVLMCEAHTLIKKTSSMLARARNTAFSKTEVATGTNWYCVAFNSVGHTTMR